MAKRSQKAMTEKGPRPLFAKNRTKLTLILDQDACQVLDELKERMEPQTKAEVIRIAVSILNELVGEYDSGSTFGIKRDTASRYEPYTIIR